MTLLRSDSESGTFEAVPTGSAIMSPSNRLNPMLSDHKGRYAWDVVGGYYKVRVEARHCTAPDGSLAAYSAVLPVPPEQLNIDLVLHCTAPPVSEDTVRIFNGSTAVEVPAEALKTANTLANAGRLGE